MMLQVASGLGLCEAELSSCSVTDVLRGQHAALGAVGSSVVGGGDPTAADLPAAALARFVKVCRLPQSGPQNFLQTSRWPCNIIRGSNACCWPHARAVQSVHTMLPFESWLSFCRTGSWRRASGSGVSASPPMR